MDRKSSIEIWKDIEGYEGLYQVSSEGRVKSLWFGKEKILKLQSDKDGYYQVQLHKDGKTKNHKVHRLVAQAFLPNPDNLPEVNHRNEDKTENRVENIEYCDGSYNLNYGTRIKRITKANSISILQFSRTGEFIRKWDSTKDIERGLGIKHSNISKCCKGKYKTAGGYKWCYADDYERIPFKIFDLELYRWIS